ncbi:MAG: hypothetical protein ACE5OZ_20880 [Candidatus Heimdallarchaeota archaeon]
MSFCFNCNDFPIANVTPLGLVETWLLSPDYSRFLFEEIAAISLFINNIIFLAVMSSITT